MGSIFFFAIERKKEARSKKQEQRAKRQEARDLSADRQARGKSREARTKRPVCRQAGKSREEIELFAVRFLCACLPQAGLCAFARKKKKEPCLPTGRQETRAKKQETRSKRQEPRTKRIKSRFSHLASTIQISISQK
jgi:hypothetical protein